MLCGAFCARTTSQTWKVSDAEFCVLVGLCRRPVSRRTCRNFPLVAITSKVNGVSRVNGDLAVSRAFGDARHKNRGGLLVCSFARFFSLLLCPTHRQVQI